MIDDVVNVYCDESCHLEHDRIPVMVLGAVWCPRSAAHELLSKLPQDVQRVAQRKLKQVNAAATLESLRIPPGNRLELLSGDRSGQWSIRINDQWRICFHWENGNAQDVEIVDYHGEEQAITADTALRLARFFGTDARSWMNLQAEFDLEIGEGTLADRIEREVTPWQHAA